MKTISFFALLVLISCSSEPSPLAKKTENDCPESGEMTNSFASHFCKTNINYSYTDSTQTHDYSNNWDFDGDKINDSIRFIGTNGAHLYFYLSIKLSSEKTPRNYEWIENDDPWLQTYKELNDTSNYFHNFAVHDFNKDGIDDIFVSDGNNAAFPIHPEWKKRGLKSNYVVMSYDFKKLDFEFSDWKGNQLKPKK